MASFSPRARLADGEKRHFKLGPAMCYKFAGEGLHAPWPHWNLKPRLTDGPLRRGHNSWARLNIAPDPRGDVLIAKTD